MAAQSRREKTLKMKIDDLNQVKKQIVEHVDQLTRLGMSWIESQAVENSYQDVREQLEFSIDLLYEVLDKMNGPTSITVSSTLEAGAIWRNASGTALEDIFNRMDALDNGGNAVLNQVGQIDQAVKNLVHGQSESERRLAEIERWLTKSDTRCDPFEERMTKWEKRNEQVVVRVAKSEGRVQELEKSRQEEKKEIDELREELGKASVSGEGGAVGARQLVSTQEGQGFITTMPDNSQPLKLISRKPIECLTNVIKNVDNHYDPNTCTYTVPVTGDYKIRLSHTQCREDEKGYIKLGLMCYDGANGKYFGFRTETWGSTNCRRASGVHLQDTQEIQVKLSANDILWLKVLDVDADARLIAGCFSCELLQAD